MNGDVYRLGGSLGRRIESGLGGVRREVYRSPDEASLHLLSACMSFRIQSRRLARENLPGATVQEELKERLRILGVIARAPAADLEVLTAKIEVAGDVLGNEDYTGASRALLLSCFGDCDRLLDPGIAWEDAFEQKEPVLSGACSSAWDALGRITREIEAALQADGSEASAVAEARHAAVGQCWTRLEETLREVAGLAAATAAGVLAKQRILTACLRFDGATAALPALLNSFFQDIDALAARSRRAGSNAGFSGPPHSVI